MTEGVSPSECPEPFWHETHNYCPCCTWTRPEEPKPPTPMEQIEQRLRERLVMAREVLDREGYGSTAALIPIEEVLIWIEEVRV